MTKFFNPGREGGGLNIYVVHYSVYSTINIGRELWNGLYICPCDKKEMLGVIKMYGKEGGGLYTCFISKSLGLKKSRKSFGNKKVYIATKKLL